jgi:outer membrane receptor protein involved in Fe transport
VSGRVQFLLTPNQDLNVRLEADVTPRAAETTNGATYNRPNAFATFSNGSAYWPSSTSAGSTAYLNSAPVKLGRSWFTNNTGYTVAGNYYSGPDNDAQHGLVTGSNGAQVDVNYKLGANGPTLTSITAIRDYHFDAVNDDGTPFDITRNSGGFFNDYRQKSEELRITSPTGGFVDYQAGLFLMQTKISAIYNVYYGDDAGAYYASTSQYATLDADASGQLLMENSLANLGLAYNSPSGLQLIDNKSVAIYAQSNWHFTDKFTVTTGARLTREDRRSVDSSYITNNGDGSALNPVAINGVALGGFDSNATTGALATDNSADQITLANSVAQEYFGVATYAALTAAQQKEVAAAKTLRATKIGVLYNPVAAQPFVKVQPALVLSPSYKITPDVTSYFTFQHGEKAGISQVINGISALVAPEKTNAFELGLKTALLEKTLVLNADIFDMRLSNYQQAVSVVDQYTTNLNALPGGSGLIAYTSAAGNVPKVDTRGLEVDGVYAGIPRTTLRFSGAYNLARYIKFPNSAQPVENAYSGAPAYQDVSGQVMAGAPRVTFNVGGDYWQPLTADKDVHGDFNVAYTDKFNSDVSLSQYAEVGRGVVTDFSFGLGKHDKTFDASIIIKNAFNNKTPTAVSATSVTPSQPRAWAIQFTGKL